MQLIGRSSSNFTRVALLFAHELGVDVELVVVHDMTRTDANAYAGNPARKLPTLRDGDTLVFGAENICRTLAERAGASDRIVWPEQLRDIDARNAQELVWHGMAAQVQFIMGTIVAKLPADNLYFVKSREGFLGALQWLDAHLASVLRMLPADRQLSLLEVSLFCLLEHIRFRSTLPLDGFPALVEFAAAFATRPSAQRTAYRFDTPPAAT